MKRTRIILLAFVICSCSEKKQGAEVQESKPEPSVRLDTVIDKSTTLSVGVFDYFMPLSDSKPDSVSKRQGIYTDIAHLLAESLGKKLHLYFEKDYYFQRPIRKGILARRCQVQLGIPDPKGKFIRKDKVFATKPYMVVGYVLVLPKGSAVKKITDLKGKKVAFLSGSPPHTTIANVEAGFEPISNEYQAMAFLSEGKVDAAFLWGPRAGYINKYIYNNQFDIFNTPYKWDVVMGLRTEDEALLIEINKKMPELKKRIQELEAEYGMIFSKTMSIPKSLLPFKF